jgi:two-component system alkaline phosphatase synthesis response regulator PhoP
MSALVYYVEDDTNIRELASYALGQAGLEIRGFAEADSFFAACAQSSPSLVILDIMLPGMDGLDILRRLRHDARTGDLPIMMLTARGTELDVVAGLEAGADDYLVKPFSMMELVSRVKALLRMAARGQGSGAPSSLSHGPLILDLAQHRVLAEGREVVLTVKEFALLETFMEQPGRVFTRSQLLERVWGYDYGEATRTVDVHIQTLRQKLGFAGAHIKTVRGVGYRLATDEADSNQAATDRTGNEQAATGEADGNQAAAGEADGNQTAADRQDNKQGDTKGAASCPR